MIAEDPIEDSGEARMFKVRPYALTGGRTRSAHDLPLETVVTVTPRGEASVARLALERKRITQMVSEPLSIAEISAHLQVPLGVARVLVGDLCAEGLLESHRPQLNADERPDLKLLERVLDGLQAL